MKSGIFSLRRLRWKLTFSYTLVTVVALLFLEFLVVTALIAFVRSPALPYFIAQDVRDIVAQQMRPGLSQTPPDVKVLREEMRPFLKDLSVAGTEDLQQNGGMDIPLAPDDGYLFVVDENRRLMVTSREISGTPEGQRLDARSLSGLAPLLDRALKGEDELLRLSGYSPDGRLMLAVSPVEDDEGEVLGAVVTAFNLPNLTAPLLVTVGVGAVLLMIPAAFLGTLFGFFTAWGLTRRLKRLAAAARAWSRGDFSVTTTDRSKDELGQLSRELNNMAAQVENLMQTRGELATLEARNRFARDLHDSVKQQVFATSLQIAAARALISRDTGAAETHLSQADELVRQAQKELNVLIQEMRPAALEGKGLAAALRDYVKDWSRQCEVPAEFHVRGEREVPLETEQALFRVAQEALANVAKHSDAKGAEVDLVYDNDSLTLRVADDGKGFDRAERDGKGFGLQSMRERLAKLGGRVDVESVPGGGTRVVCVCPLGDASKEKGRRIWASR